MESDAPGPARLQARPAQALTRHGLPLMTRLLIRPAQARLPAAVVQAASNASACRRDTQLRSRQNPVNIDVTRAQRCAGKQNVNHYFIGAEHTMNQINVETNVVETEANELQSLAIAQADAVVELNSAQLFLVGGGQGINLLI